MAHYDAENNNVYLNGQQVRNCLDIWHNVDNLDETISWRAKHKAKEIEIARLEASGIKIERQEFDSPPLTMWENFGVILIIIGVLALLAGILYLIYQAWWFFIGDSAFEGPFADDISAGDVVFRTIVFFIAFIVIIEEVIRRIINGHF